MYTEARKLHLIEAILRTTNDATLEAIESLVNNGSVVATKSRQTFNDLLGTLTAEEADAMKKTIEENFEKINPDDWK